MKTLTMSITVYILNGIYLMALDTINSKILSLFLRRNQQFDNICEISVDNKAIEETNLFCVFHNPLFIAAPPSTFAHFDTQF